jgi:HrpA-like RNA helicase
MTEEAGGILVFLTGQEEITTVHKILMEKIQTIE